MKNFRNCMLAFMLVLAAALILPAKADAETTLTNLPNLTVTYTPADTSVTLNWKGVTNLPKGYTLKKYLIRNARTSKVIKTIAVNKDASDNKYSYTVENLNAGYIGYWEVSYVCKDASGISSETATSLYVNTTPTSCSSYGIESAYTCSGAGISSFKIKFKASLYNKGEYKASTYAQVALYKSGKLVKVYDIGNYASGYCLSNAIKVSSNATYRYKVRSCFKNPKSDKVYTGAWSAYKYFEVPRFDYSTCPGVRGARVTLRKVSSVCKYVISVSTNSKTGFKKTYTVTLPKSTKTINVTRIRKSVLKKGKTYYVHVIPYIKTQNGIVKSGIVGNFHFYNYS